MADPIEQQVVDAVLEALKSGTCATGVVEGVPPSEFTSEKLPFLWVDVAVGPPSELGTNHVIYELTFTARGAFKYRDACDLYREGRKFIAEQQQAVMTDFTQSMPQSGDTREAGHEIGATGMDGIGGTQAAWVVKYRRLRNNPFGPVS